MSYIIQNPGIVWGLLLEHIIITGSSLLIAIAIAFPFGVLVADKPRLATPVLGFLGILYTIPSIALMILLLPIVGLGRQAIIVTLVVYAQVILVRNIIAGLRAVDPVILEAAHGMGMNSWQRLWQIQLPQALPVILAGVRIAAIVDIAIATIGAKFGAGGLGELLFQGIAQAGRYDKIWAGALSVAALALIVNWSLLALERAFDTTRRIRRSERRQLAIKKG
ncbi:MAG: hypothetical protein KatS3mg057_2437 [Herpetosiphonaceae bacterium]|nr:MAG: hypothetical protein KatS3mg057_2437 [Herpetosiphonaceae bacterium]